MGDIFVVVEHRQGVIREITHEMLWKAGELGRALSRKVSAVLFCHDGARMIEEIRDRADRILLVESDAFKNFSSDLYKELLARLIAEHAPFLTLMGHTAWGMDLAPALSVKSGLPLATDCMDILWEGDRLKAVRQVYSGKLFSKVSFKEAPGYLATIRAGAFPQEKSGERSAEVQEIDLPADLPAERRRFVEFVDTGAGKVDISQADLLISVGRGIGEEENIGKIKELADRLGGVLACSRPVVDKNWLPKYHQVGTSGKSVKPKVYLALGISGAFQHVAGISGAGTVIAVNKDKKAPIFRVAHYGVVDDLFKVADALMEKIGG
ncbi:MAG: electron transfer flavoprotein subunit alpha/FixB family protein [Deltaproteobacteria bacterium]|nr:electron transfer flavoprotein subunit alpha/FixB family protein [Deltaproteobacteria bacterium]